MFYTWQSELRKVKGDAAAALMHPRSEWAGREPEFWWGKPTPTEQKRMYEFIIDPQVILTDDQSTLTSALPLYSDRLVRLLEEYGVHLEKFPAHILDSKSLEVISDRYCIVNILEMVFGDKNTNIKDFPKNLSLFRLEGRRDLLIVRDDLKEELKNKGMTGVLIIPWEEFQNQKMPLGEVLNPISQTASIWRKRKKT